MNLLDLLFNMLIFFKKLFFLIMTPILVFITPIQGLLIMMAVMVGFDTIFGIYASIKLKGRRSFRSHKLFNFGVKLFVYLGVILMAYCADVFIVGGSLMGIKYLLAKGACSVFVYTEAKSLDETSMKLGNRSFWVILTELVGKVKGLKKDYKELEEDGDK